MQPLIKPQISLNGTSKERLLEQQQDVLECFHQLMDAMSEAMPHGRDYIRQPFQYPLARDAWLERLKAIQALSDEIEQHAISISET
jgi:hypothetical protein